MSASPLATPGTPAPRRTLNAESEIVIIGGGPAGLTAAYELSKFDWRPIVLEQRPLVGGLASTHTYKGFHFDMGGHRFFSKVEEVRKMWDEVLREDFLRRPRLSRIYYNGRFFYYPLRPLNALRGLGLRQSILVSLSYLWWQLFRYRQENTFEHWVTNRFGRRLFRTFFKTYTEKVWGIPCSELKAEWAAQRIKDLSLKTALLSMFLKPKKTIKSLIEEFHYPRLGPGMMWSAVKDEIERRQGTVRLNSEVVRINRAGNRIDSVVVTIDGREELIRGTEFISSMPLTDFIKRLHPRPPIDVLTAAERLRYRDFLTVVLIVNRPQVFQDNWIYVHDPEVKVGRIQNFKNWSPDMVPDPAKTSLGLEYFCTEGDALWDTPDGDLIEQAKREVDRINLARYSDIEDGCVVRVPKAYPVYDSEYRECLGTVRRFVDGLDNLQTIGRNGLHRYNNQDHAMMTGMLAVRNVVLGQSNDLWSVNTDHEYHEEVRDTNVEALDLEEVIHGALAQVFFKLDRLALGVSVGIASGLLLFLATLGLLLRGGEVLGPTLSLLGQYFPGYSVTASGSVLGLSYGFFTGFIGGWLFAFLRNATVFLYLAITEHRAEHRALRRLLEYL
jgi:protoporphyrinogen oxidase